MVDPKLLEQLKTASVNERIAVLEMLVQSLKSDIKPSADTSVETTIASQRPAFGFMKATGAILGDVAAPVPLQNAWEVLQWNSANFGSSKTPPILMQDKNWSKWAFQKTRSFWGCTLPISVHTSAMVLLKGKIPR